MVETGRDKSELPYFTDDGKFIPRWLAEDIQSDLNFVTHQQSEKIYVYEDGIYRPRGKQIIENEAQKRLGDFARQRFINETVNLIRFSTYRPPEDFNNPNNMLAVKNGFLNPVTRELEEFTPEKIHLTKINAKFDREADCPKVKKFLTEILHDKDILTVQEMFGYCLLKDYPLAKAFMLLGSGANGKSTLLKLLEIFLGEDNVANPSLQTLLDDKFASHRLFGKLANIHADLSSSEVLENTGKFKMLTGQDRMEGQEKYKNAFEFRNYAKLIYSANELPRTKDRTEAFFRRWIIIEFPNQFPEEDEDTDTSLPESIIDEEELSGVLNWALDGLERLLKNDKFTRTKARREVEERWIMQTDSLRAFLLKKCETKTGAWVSKKDFYEVYQAFCNKHNIFVAKKGQVTKRLPTLKPNVKIFRPVINGERVRCWENLTFKEKFLEKDYVKEINPLHSKSDEQSGIDKTKRSQKELINDIREALDLGDFSKRELVEHLAEEGYNRKRVEMSVGKLLEKGVIQEGLGGGISFVQ